MKLWLIGALMVAAAATTLPLESQAKRLGGGNSAGMQRNMPARTAPDATPAKPAQAQPAAAPGTPAAAAAAPKRNWMGPLAGLAAGLGLAALMSHLGLGAGFANILMMALLAGGAIFLVMFLMRRFGGGAVGRNTALAGAGGGMPAGGSQVAWPPVQSEPVLERRALESGSAVPARDDMPGTAADPADGTLPAAAAADGVGRAFVPASFDTDGFSRTAKLIFIRLQAANDTSDLDDLRRFTTPELFATIRLEIQERGATAQHTDVVKVEATVLDVANEQDRQVVSVRFHGQTVEEKGAAATDFNEVWHLVKPHDDSRPWAIAGIEQMT